jgi:hypothetical protein
MTTTHSPGPHTPRDLACVALGRAQAFRDVAATSRNFAAVERYDNDAAKALAAFYRARTAETHTEPDEQAREDAGRLTELGVPCIVDGRWVVLVEPGDVVRWLEGLECETPGCERPGGRWHLCGECNETEIPF